VRAFVDSFWASGLKRLKAAAEAEEREKRVVRKN